MSDFNKLFKNFSNKKINNILKPINLKNHIHNYKTVTTQTKNDKQNNKQRNKKKEWETYQKALNTMNDLKIENTTMKKLKTKNTT